jgi:hypothetical protein
MAFLLWHIMKCNNTEGAVLAAKQINFMQYFLS